ncbi:hypothetical protein F53441_8645 [Fusarium austroafricanum]|uniref:Uncharacterized protein n=1 Tax=Fusarium austroafricanum TaxID=2364996 RepID=A0A8H4KAZ4_9HYPO|nr:hypothetical protein F53441_8645 [Fusarium austroafricanum]
MNNSKTEQSSDHPPWLVRVGSRIEEEEDEICPETPYYEIVRDLLLAPEDDDSAVAKAVTQFYDLYVSEAGKEKREPPEYGAGYSLDSIASIAFELTYEVWYTSAEHERLAKFLIAIKSGAADKYDEEDPQFVYFDWGLEAAADQSWNVSHVDYYTGKNSGEPEDPWAGPWFSTAALIAKVFQGGCLENAGPRWIAGDFKRTFELPTSGDIKTDAGRQAQVLATVNYILLAGEAFVAGAKGPSPKWHFEHTVMKWKLWASKVKEVADAVDENARWDLKERAQRAYDKMVELLPEAFESE